MSWKCDFCGTLDNSGASCPNCGAARTKKYRSTEEDNRIIAEMLSQGSILRDNGMFILPTDSIELIGFNKWKIQRYCAGFPPLDIPAVFKLLDRYDADCRSSTDIMSWVVIELNDRQ